MEIKIKLPSGGYVEFKREPMSWERFCAICILIGTYIVGSGIIKFLRYRFERREEVTS